MRKIFVVILALMASSMTLRAERVSEEEAALVANNFMNVRASSAVPGMKKAVPAKRMVRKHTSSTADNRYYIYENADSEGWVIIAANDAVHPVLAYSETGHFRTDSMPSNIRRWLGKYDRFITRLEADSITASEEAKAQWGALRKAPRAATPHTPVIGPLIQTQWDQEAPYNDLCPGTGSNKAYTGCVATAMAQVMNYWQWPKKGTGSKSYRPLNPERPENFLGWPNYSSDYTETLFADFENTTYDWENMRNKYLFFSPAASKKAVATLMYHCGVATEMMYGNQNNGGSGTYTLNYNDWTWGTPESEEAGGCAQNALWYYFGYKKDSLTAYARDGYTQTSRSGYKYTYYDSWTDKDWTAMVKAELDKGRPILYGGASSEGGHSFICDGYDEDGYFHFNWGWSGAGDGYYRLSSLVPGSGGAGGGNYDFNEDQDVLIGIVPDRPEEPQKEDTEAIENNEVTIPASKIIDGNQVVIVRDGKKYDLMGIQIQ